ncbi:MAG: hypothetical protein JW746_07770 [Candidatus Krumholzibacteriota bacterium]|nr:hypothetical protein [Candidatus Krumholzibacteriota bacterium]
MTYSKTDSTRLQVDREIAGKIKKRIRLLVFCSALTVALAFGMSFYFALVYNTSAVSSQFPELLPIVSKLKNLLVVNTFAFSLIIIGSFYYLSILVTKRIFKPLESIHKDIISISKNKLPQVEKIEDQMIFSSLNNAFALMVENLRDREIDERNRLFESLGTGPEAGIPDKSRKLIESMIAEKDLRSGAERASGAEGVSGGGIDDGAVFMQQS